MIRSLVIFLAVLAPLTAAAGTPALQSAQRMVAKGQLPRALQTLDRILGRQPRDVRARFLKGVVLARQGRAAEAIRIYTALSQDDPRLPEPHNNLAVLYANAGQYGKARTELEAALRTSHSYDTAYRNLSKIYAKLATLAYDKALQLGGKNKKTQNNPLQLVLLDNLASVQPSPARPATMTPAAPTLIATAKKTPPPPAPRTPRRPAAEKPATRAPAKKIAVKTPEKIAPELARAEAVVGTVKAWAHAWSEQNVGRYLAFYGEHFAPPRGQSRSHWEKMRRRRIMAPKFIQIKLTAINVTFRDDTHAVVTFRQHYHANTFTGATAKTLTLTRQGKQWLIEDERVRR